MKRLILLTAITLLNLSFAQISLDRTRIIFDQGKSNSESIVLSNSSKTEPYLAQSWIEDEKGNKIESPLVALPILQRLNPGQEKRVKISLAGKNNLPTDRESMLVFNVLGVPPKATNIENKLNIVVQSKAKLFYRPKGLKQYKDNGWIQELQVSKNGNSYTLKNPTPYHIVIYAFTNGPKGKVYDKYLVIKPFDSAVVKEALGNNPVVYFINDYGGTEKNIYQCGGSSCTLTANERN